MPPTCPIRTAWSASGGLERQGKPQKRQHSSLWSSFRQSPSISFHFERLFRQSDRIRPQIALKISLSHFFDKKTSPQNTPMTIIFRFSGPIWAGKVEFQSWFSQGSKNWMPSGKNWEGANGAENALKERSYGPETGVNVAPRGAFWNWCQCRS